MTDTLPNKYLSLQELREYFKAHPIERLSDSTFTYRNITLVKTCSACPEQYDAMDESGAQVGYLRLRHGEFTVTTPRARGETVYTALPNGDGMFEDDEREKYLMAAIDAILAA